MSSDPTRNVKPLFMALLALFPIIALLAVVWIAKTYFGIEISDVTGWFERASRAPYARVIIIAVFIVGSFLSLPQWALFVAVISVFGPIEGAVLSWIATLCSASVNFMFGRLLGRARFKRYLTPDGRLDRFFVHLRNNGFLASFSVRLVPTGPFVLVNMLAGASGLGYGSFVGGTALGVIPKVLIVAFIAQGIIAKESGWLVMFAFILAAFAVIGLIWGLRRRLSVNG